MSNIKFISTKPGAIDYYLFTDLPQKLYKKDSLRFKLGHDPSQTHLKNCYILLENDIPVARYAFYENHELKYLDKPTACIGSYECVDNADLSAKLLTHAKELAISKGYYWLIGPMEGSTWNNYRFSNSNDHPNFFLEPYHHSYYNEHFRNAGFESIAQYFSTRIQQLDYDKERLDSFEKHYLDKGAKFRNLNLDELESELEKIAIFSLDAFSSNFLYSSITVRSFIDKYLSLRQFINPKLVWIVEDTIGDIQAILFNLEDFYDAEGETLIIKSLARKPSSSYRGIGSYLVEKTTQIAADAGYKNVIHAYMIKNNESLIISEKNAGEDYKSYSLYGLAL